MIYCQAAGYRLPIDTEHIPTNYNKGLPEEKTMESETLTLQIDADLAQAYQAASAKEQSKLQLLLNLWLRDLYTQSTSLKSLLDELSEKAEGRGLTAKKLEELLRAD